jgi:hypothetical protein
MTTAAPGRTTPRPRPPVPPAAPSGGARGVRRAMSVHPARLLGARGARATGRAPVTHAPAASRARRRTPPRRAAASSRCPSHLPADAAPPPFPPPPPTPCWGPPAPKPESITLGSLAAGARALGRGAPRGRRATTGRRRPPRQRRRPGGREAWGRGCTGRGRHERGGLRRARARAGGRVALLRRAGPCAGRPCRARAGQGTRRLAMGPRAMPEAGAARRAAGRAGGAAGGARARGARLTCAARAAVWFRSVKGEFTAAAWSRRRC